LILFLLLLWDAASFPHTPAEVSSLSFCRPQFADTARPGLWECSRLGSDSARVLVRVQDDGRGAVRYLEWSAEQGAEAVHLPDAAFWKILDAFAGEGEWGERDPGTIGPDTAVFPGALGQAFECLGCPEPLLAGTWGPFGASRLLIASRHPGHDTAAARLGLRSVKDISTLALPPLSSQPCREKEGTCEDVRSGPGGTRWRFRRSHPDSSWESLRVEWTGTSIGDSVSLDQMRDDLPPKEMQLLLSNWLDSECDLFAANVLTPGQAFLTATPAQWRSRRLPGFQLKSILDRLKASHSVPASLFLYGDSWCRAGIEGRLRWMELGKIP
jgi:hypothetical protein